MDGMGYGMGYGMGKNRAVIWLAWMAWVLSCAYVRNTTQYYCNCIKILTCARGRIPHAIHAMPANANKHAILAWHGVRHSPMPSMPSILKHIN